MKIFIDSANLSQVKEINDMGILDGVTTNPTLMSKEGITGKKAIFEHYKTICETVKGGDISAEVISTGFDEMIKEGQELAAIHPNIVVKIPMIKDGVKAIHWLTAKGIRINCTLVFSAGQALLAAKAGAYYVSPFIGRIDDSGWNGLVLIEEISKMFQAQNYSAKILAASIRSALQIPACAIAGAHACTSPYEPILGLLKHPLTDTGLKKFVEDAQKLNLS